MTTHQVRIDNSVESAGLSSVQLMSPAGIDVRFVPEAGMVGCSLTHHGAQLLGMRAGIEHYVKSGGTMGIPLLAPWANRLASDEYSCCGVDVTVTGVRGIHRDGNGLPIHGLLSAAPGWNVVETDADDTHAKVRATLDFNVDRDEYLAFPFPHLLSIEATLAESTLTITTAVEPTTQQPVPIAFGWHPYFNIPDAPRRDWIIDVPFTRHVVLDDRCIPTGEIDDVAPVRRKLADTSFDDLYCEVAPGTTASISGGSHSISLRYDAGYPYGIVFAPLDDDVVALEPMTAPTNPFGGTFPIRCVQPGDRFEATFSIVVDTNKTPRT